MQTRSLCDKISLNDKQTNLMIFFNQNEKWNKIDDDDEWISSLHLEPMKSCEKSLSKFSSSKIHNWTVCWYVQRDKIIKQFATEKRNISNLQFSTLIFIIPKKDKTKKDPKNIFLHIVVSLLAKWRRLFDSKSIEGSLREWKKSMKNVGTIRNHHKKYDDDVDGKMRAVK